MNSFAVIRSGGKQYKVAEGDTISVEKINKVKDSTFNLSEVLLIVKESVVTIGKPIVTRAKIKVRVLDNFRDSKIKVVKFKSKSRYLKTMGHRQSKTKLQIEKIVA